MNFRDRNILITDIETTGLDPKLQDMIEIGSIKVNQNLEEIARFDAKISIQHPETVSLKALEINGYTPDKWKDAKSLKLVMEDFYQFAKEGILSSWNITFEYNFIEESFNRSSLTNPMDYHRIDIPSLAWFELTNLEKLSLDYAAKELGLPSEPKPHRAITGAQYALDVLRILRNKREQRKSA